MTNPLAMIDNAEESTKLMDLAASKPAELSNSIERAEVSWWEWTAFTAARTASVILLKALTLPGLYRFGRLFGTIEWLINHNRRRRFHEVLEKILGRRPTPSERRRFTRDHFAQSRCDKLFSLVFDGLSREAASRLLSIRRRDLLDDALLRGRGVYIALSHHGALHVIALLMALMGYKTAGVRDRNEGGLRRYLRRRLAEKHPEFRQMRVIYADSYPREIYRCLQEGHVLGSAMDVSRVRKPGQKTEEVEVFGRRHVFLSGPLRIALRCGTPVLQAFVIPEPGFRYRLDITGILADPGDGRDESEVVARAMNCYAAGVEKCLRETPSLATRV